MKMNMKMKKKINYILFIDHQTDKYFLLRKPDFICNCVRCKTELIDHNYYYYNRTFNSKGMLVFEEIYCEKCIAKRRKFQVDEVTQVILISDNKLLGLGCSIIPNYKPTLKGSKTTPSNYDNLSSDETINKTKYAGRFTLEGASVGAKIDDKKEQERTKQLNDKEVSNLLDDLTNSELVTPKRIEDKKD